MIITPSYTFARPADTTSYTSGDLVANDVDAADVVPMSFDLSKYGHAASGKIRRVRLFKDDETVTAATFNVHLFSSSPVVTNGDNGAFAVSTAAGFLGTVAVDMSSGAFATTTDLAKAAVANPEINVDLGAGKIYGLLEVTGGYAPSSGEVFTVTLEIEKA